METPTIDGQVKVQVFASEAIGIGNIAIVIDNCPITEVDGQLKPCMKMPARQAMEIGMNLIYIAKIAEGVEQAQKEDKSER